MVNSESWERYWERRREEFEESKCRCYVCGKKIKNLKGIIKSDNKLYCSFECLNKDINIVSAKEKMERRKKNEL